MSDGDVPRFAGAGKPVRKELADSLEQEAFGYKEEDMPEMKKKIYRKMLYNK